MSQARLIAWLSMNLGFGSLPPGLTFLAYVVRKHSEPLREPLRLEELMFLVVMLIATTMMDLVITDLGKSAKTLCSAILLLLFSIAMALYSANLFSSDSDSRDVLLLCGVVLVGLVAMSTLSIQVFLNRGAKTEGP